MKKSFVVSILMVLGFSMVLAAEELPMTEMLLFQELPMITSATLTQQTTLDAPAAVNVITAEEITKKGYLSLKDIMLDIPGWADVSDANENIVAVRGAHTSSTNKILILVNGHRMNDLNLGRYNTDVFLGLEGVERVEFIRGAGSVLYGTGALLGVVNVVMKKGEKLGGFTLKPRFSLFENTNRHYEGHATWGQKIEGWNMSFSATYVNSEGAQIKQSAALDRAPAGQTPAEGVVYWNQYPSNWNAYTNVSNDNTHLDLRVAHSSRTVPRAPGTNSLIDYGKETIKPDYEQDDVFVNFKKTIPVDDKSKVTINPSFHDFDLREYTWIPTYGANRLPPNGSRSGQVTREQHWQLQTLYENQVDPTLNLIGGIDLLLADFESSCSLSVNTAGNFVLTPYRMDYSTWLVSSALVQGIWSPLSYLQVTLSGRADMFQDMADPRFTPRAGVVYKPLEELAVKAVYGQSYLSPQWAHIKSSQANNAFLANKDLNPETFEGLDFIVDYQKGDLSANADFFLNKINGLISASKVAGTNTNIYVNADRTAYQGVDAEVKYQVIKEAAVQAGYSYVSNAGSSSVKYVKDNIIVGVPKNIGRLGFELTPIDKLSIIVWGRVYSSVMSSDVITLEKEIPAWATVDATANYLWDEWSFQVGATNLSDQKYEIGSAEINRPLPRPGRAYTVAVGYKF